MFNVVEMFVNYLLARDDNSSIIVHHNIKSVNNKTQEFFALFGFVRHLLKTSVIISFSALLIISAISL